MQRKDMPVFTTHLLPADVEPLERSCHERGLSASDVIAYHVHQGLAREAAGAPDEIAKMRWRMDDLLGMHVGVDGECWQCGAPHPCDTYVVLTQDPEDRHRDYR